MRNKTFSISSVSEITGVSKNRIREWHDKGLLPQVEWIPVGTRRHRRFTQEVINLIMKIDEYQKQGFVLGVATEKAKEKGKKELTGIKNTERTGVEARPSEIRWKRGKYQP